MWGLQSFPMLIVRGGVTISMMMGMFLFRQGLEWDDSWDECRPTSPGLHAWNWQVAQYTHDVESLYTHTHSSTSQTTTTI